MIAIFNALRPWSACGGAPNVLNPTARGQGRVFVPGRIAGRRPYIRELELIVHTRGKADFTATAPRRIARAAVVDDRRIRAIVTVRREPAAPGAEIVVGVAFVDGIRRVGIPVNVLVEAVLPRDRVHVRRVVATRRIVVMLPARISRSRSGVSPAHADVVLGENILRERHPDAVPLPLV